MDRADLEALEGALAVDDLGLGLELLAADAVQRLELAGVDVAAVVDRLHELLDALLVARLRRADEVVVRDVERREQREPRLGHELVDPLLRRRAVRRGGAHHLLAVLVGARQHPGVIARLAVPARERVDRHRRVPVADVRHIARVVDRGGDVEGTAGSHHRILVWTDAAPGRVTSAPGAEPTGRRLRLSPCAPASARLVELPRRVAGAAGDLGRGILQPRPLRHERLHLRRPPRGTRRRRAPRPPRPPRSRRARRARPTTPARQSSPRAISS